MMNNKSQQINNIHICYALNHLIKIKKWKKCGIFVSSSNCRYWQFQKYLGRTIWKSPKFCSSLFSKSIKFARNLTLTLNYEKKKKKSFCWHRKFIITTAIIGETDSWWVSKEFPKFPLIIYEGGTEKNNNNNIQCLKRIFKRGAYIIK